MNAGKGKKTIVGLSLALTMLSPAMASTMTNTPKAQPKITEAEVLQAQKAWGDALVKISKDYEQGGHAAAKASAKAVLDAAYGYDLGPVLFKPTLTVAPQTFRTSKEGALAYFVGGDKNFPNDKGFALNGWRKVEVKNTGIHLDADSAISMGNVMITDKDGKVTTVDKTWGYTKDANGNLKIVLHHSSLPHKLN